MAPKIKPKPSSPSSQTMSNEQLFTTLNTLINEEKYGKAVTVSDQILAIAPGDEDALRCKVVSLIKNYKFDQALATIQASQKFPIDFTFEKAYCLYRQYKSNEALELVKNKEDSSDTMLLESQILHRLGRIDACIDVYQKLQKKFEVESLEVNIIAAFITAGRASEVQGLMDSLKVKATSNFELAYNVACSLIEKAKYTDAEELLLTARRIGQEHLMIEEWVDDDIEIELSPIDVQLAYVQQILGHPQEAMSTYLELINKNIADDPSLAVAINNLIALKGPKDASDGLRKIDKVIEKSDDSHGFHLARDLDTKLSSSQKEAIYSNRVLLLLHANKTDQARELVSALPNMFPGSVKPILLQAAVFVRENKSGKAEEILGQFADKFPEKSKPILLARATIAAAAGHHQIASDSLLRVPEIQHMPATVATIITLKERVGDIDGASAVFDSAISYWSNAMSEDSDRKLGVIMNEAAAFKLKHGFVEEAAKLYENLYKSNGSTEALVGLVTTAAQVDIEKAENYEKKLNSLPGLKKVDVDSLEKTSGAKYVEDVRSNNIEAHDESKVKTKSKKKRKRKPRYPKGFDPANPGPLPDAERWIPRRERSTYRPKRKDKRAAQVRGSQGAVSREKQDAGAVSTSTTASVSSSKDNQPSTSKPEVSRGSSKSSRKKSRK
ncbi:hypothetical protein ACHQM5_010738 [Ranunculus cassubicifolius]